MNGNESSQSGIAHEIRAEVDLGQQQFGLQQDHRPEQAGGHEQPGARRRMLPIIVPAEGQETEADHHQGGKDVDGRVAEHHLDRRDQQQRQHQRDPADHRRRSGVALAAAVRIVDDAEHSAHRSRQTATRHHREAIPYG